LRRTPKIATAIGLLALAYGLFLFAFARVEGAAHSGSAVTFACDPNMRLEASPEKACETLERKVSSMADLLLVDAIVFGVLSGAVLVSAAVYFFRGPRRVDP
jgi:hypothetical protein